MCVWASWPLPVVGPALGCPFLSLAWLCCWIKCDDSTSSSVIILRVKIVHGYEVPRTLPGPWEGLHHPMPPWLPSVWPRSLGQQEVRDDDGLAKRDCPGEGQPDSTPWVPARSLDLFELRSVDFRMNPPHTHPMTHTGHKSQIQPARSPSSHPTPWGIMTPTLQIRKLMFMIFAALPEDSVCLF